MSAGVAILIKSSLDSKSFEDLVIQGRHGSTQATRVDRCQKGESNYKLANGGQDYTLFWVSFLEN